MLAAIAERLARSAEHAANGCDVEHYLDQLAAEAFATLYPGEVDLESLYERRAIGRVSEHVVDAVVVATLEREHTRDEDCTLDGEGFCVECDVHHGEACVDCGGRAYHRDGCPELAPASPAPQVKP